MAVKEYMTSLMAARVIETVAVPVIGAIWFFAFNTWSYLINELLPPYPVDDPDSESLLKTWMYMLLNLAITLLVFHYTVKLLKSFTKTLFGDSKLVDTLPESKGSILAAFSLLIFQASFRARTIRVWVNFFGPARA